MDSSTCPRAPEAAHAGLTHVLDKGLNLRDIEGPLRHGRRLRRHREARLGHLVRDPQPREEDRALPLVRHARRLRRNAFRSRRRRGKLDEYKSWLVEQRFSHVEISDGAIEIPRERKLELIAEFARDFTVLSEVGSKDADVNFAPYLWVQWRREELEAGAWKVITEARESGTAGIFRPTGELRTGLVDELTHELDVGDLIFEAPMKSAQAWFVKNLGPEVNLGNIPPEEVIPLETLRLGLRPTRFRRCCFLSSAPPLPELDFEAMSAEDLLRWATTSSGSATSCASRARGRSSRLCSSTWSPSSASTCPWSSSTRSSSSASRTRRATGSSSATGWSSSPRRCSRSRSSTARRGRTSGSATPTVAVTSGRSSRCWPPSSPTTPGSRASGATSRRAAPRRPSSSGRSATVSGSSTRSPTGTRSGSGATSG